MTDSDADAPQPTDAENVTQVTKGVYIVFDPQSINHYRVNLTGTDKIEVKNVDTKEVLNDPSDSTRTRVVRSAVYHAPTNLEATEEQIHILQKTADMLLNYSQNAANMSRGTPAGDGANGEDGDSGFDGDIVDNPGTHDYDANELVDAVEDWLSYKADDPTSNLIDGAWECTFKKITDPESGQSDLGVYIESDPWHGPYWDHDSRSWDTDDGSQPDEWADHNQAMRETVFNADGSPVEAVVEETDGEYDDWHNYVPAEEAQELA